MESSPKKFRLSGTFANLVAFAVGCLMVVVFFGSIEVAMRIKAHFKEPKADSLKFSSLNEYVDQETPLGFKSLPNVTLHNRTDRGERCVYEVDCTIDGSSRRMTPCDSPETRDRVAAFFGCSVTFGWGVQDKETLPARFAAYCPKYLPINYGYGGYGPQQMWLMINKLNALKDLPKTNGVIIYTFIDDHLNRLVGATSVLNSWGYSMPWLTLEEGRIKWAGNFDDRMTLQTLWAFYCQKLHLVKFLENRIPRQQPNPEPSKEAVTLLARLLQECAESAIKISPNLKFYCLVYPGTPKPYGAALATALKNCKDVSLLDYGGLFDKTQIDVDQLCFDDSLRGPWGHPKPLSYDLVAKRLAKDIEGVE